MSVPDWSTLPSDAIFTVSSHIPDDAVADYASFRSVCTSFLSAAPKRPQLPWILVVYRDGIHRSIGLCNFPNTSLSNVHRIPDTVALANSICGSSNGWIALLDATTPGILLHNPFTAAHVGLPSLTNMHSYPPEKVVLSYDPCTTTWVVLAVCCNGGRLMYCRTGDDSWSLLPSEMHDMGRINDAIYYKGMFYVVCELRVFVCDIDGAEITEILPADGRAVRDVYNNFSYLVVSAGDLLLVSVTFPDCYCSDSDCGECEKFSFEVFRVDFVSSEGIDCKMRLFKLDSLGGRSVFLGGTSMSVSAGVSPRCRGDCIYYMFSGAPYAEKWNEKIIVYSLDDDGISSVTGFSDYRFDVMEMHWLTPSLYQSII